MSTKFILILISLSGFCCPAQTYKLHIGKSFYPALQQMSMSVGSLIANVKVDSIVEFTGIYCDKHIFIDKYPVIRIYNDGKFYIPLSTKLQCPDGMLIKIKGKVIELSVTYSMIKKTLSYHHLEPIEYEVVFNTQQLIKNINDEYDKIRQKLQEQITLEQSKLQLVEDPKWAIWYDEEQKIFIFHSHQYDLMYAADIELIVDAQKKKIRDVYAKEWFKGE
jgi:hypothetical protein